MRPGVRRAVRLIAWMTAGLVAAAGCAALYSQIGYRKTWDRPLADVRAVSDPTVIARGRYIVYGPGRCADCHVPDEARPALLRGEEVPLTGGPGEHTFIGTWSAPNLTPDRETGLGRVSDGQIARMLRYGVNREGRIAPPFMDIYADLTEEDLLAVISYLRSIPPARGIPPAADINILGKLTLAYFLSPYAPAGIPRDRVLPEASVEYGDYVANTLAGCRSCHTARNLKTGEYLSPFFSGGLAFRAHQHPGYMYVSPNLTSDTDTGRIAGWTEDAFVQRFKAGLLIEDSPMPWANFMHMTDTDLRALFRYLHSLPPVRRDNGPSMQKQKGSVAG